jgi:hypothetical protein
MNPIAWAARKHTQSKITQRLSTEPASTAANDAGTFMQNCCGFVPLFPASEIGRPIGKDPTRRSIHYLEDRRYTARAAHGPHSKCPQSVCRSAFQAPISVRWRAGEYRLPCGDQCRISRAGIHQHLPQWNCVKCTNRWTGRPPRKNRLPQRGVRPFTLNVEPPFFRTPDRQDWAEHGVANVQRSPEIADGSGNRVPGLRATAWSPPSTSASAN